MQFNDLMVDLETLGTIGSDVIIAQIGLVAFDIKTGERASKSFEAKFCIQEQLDKGFRVEASTMLFWLNQPKEAQSLVFEKEDVKTSNTYVWTQVNDYIEKNTNYKGVNIWCHADFDGAKIQHHMKTFGVQPVWGKKVYLTHKNFQHIRTLEALTNYSVKRPQMYGVLHDAVCDCINQIEYCHLMYKELTNV